MSPLQRDRMSTEPASDSPEPPPDRSGQGRPSLRTTLGHDAGSPSAASSGRGATVLTENLRAYYGSRLTIKGVSLTFPPNQVTAIIGPSGSGKSTVVRCINRMHEEIPGARAEGRVMLDREDIYGARVDITQVRRVVGMVFQRPNPFPTMSIYDNVAAGLKLAGIRGPEVKERVHRSLRAVGLWDEVSDRLSAPGIGLSGGQQQRLCIARTIAIEPEVILMDEPCSALDPIATLKVEELIDELKSRYTIVIVTHNMQQAARVADSTVFMLDGEVVEHAKTNTIFTNPSDERTERYVTGKFG
jgi:phosphate transport system ATP-binding protein